MNKTIKGIITNYRKQKRLQNYKRNNNRSEIKEEV